MIKTKAIVLRKRDLGDHNNLVSFYTLDFGKIDLISRGTKRASSKISGHLDLLNLVDLMIIKGREKYYVGSAISENSFLNIKNNYDLATASGEAIYFLNKLTFPNQTDFNSFLTLKDFLVDLNDNFNNYLIKNNLNYFKIKILYLLGYYLDFSSCSLCGCDRVNFFDFFSKEFLCLKCCGNKNNLLKISSRLIEIKKSIVDTDIFDWKKISISEKENQELTRFIDVIRKII
jgi:DNA repair protein RecO (recombination protein O)